MLSAIPLGDYIVTVTQNGFANLEQKHYRRLGKPR